MKIARGEGEGMTDQNRLPYSFARRHGFVAAATGEDELVVTMREGADPHALVELRRFLARPFALRKVDPAGFDRLLSDF